jgi:hypothetical protein
MVTADKPDFSGAYTLRGIKGGFKMKKGDSWTLRVVQGEAVIEITKVMDVHQNTNKYRLDSTQGVYDSPGGPKGTCTARFKGKSLILDAFVTMHAQPNGPVVQIHTRERWELSLDSKTLTIRTDLDGYVQLGASRGFTKSPERWSEIYWRD